MEASLTFLLTLSQQGDRAAEGAAIGLTYQKLRTMARSLLSRERRGHTLQATALVSEVFLQKLRRISVPIESREHYYSLAAHAMREVLIDHARRRSAQRRHASVEAVADLLMSMKQPTASEDRLAVQQALSALAELDAKGAACIRYRFLEGLSIQQTAHRLGRPVWRVRADCDFGLSWMARHLGGAR